MPDASAQFAALIGRMTQSICSGEPEAADDAFRSWDLVIEAVVERRRSRRRRQEAARGW